MYLIIQTLLMYLEWKSLNILIDKHDSEITKEWSLNLNLKYIDAYDKFLN